MFVTVFTKSCHLSPHWSRWIRSNPSQPVCCNITVLQFSHLRLRRTIVLPFLWVSQTNSCCISLPPEVPHLQSCSNSNTNKRLCTIFCWHYSGVSATHWSVRRCQMMMRTSVSPLELDCIVRCPVGMYSRCETEPCLILTSQYSILCVHWILEQTVCNCAAQQTFSDQGAKTAVRDVCGFKSFFLICSLYDLSRTHFVWTGDILCMSDQTAVKVTCLDNSTFTYGTRLCNSADYPLST